MYLVDSLDGDRAPAAGPSGGCFTVAHGCTQTSLKPTLADQIYLDLAIANLRLTCIVANSRLVPHFAAIRLTSNLPIQPSTFHPDGAPKRLPKPQVVCAIRSLGGGAPPITVAFNFLNTQPLVPLLGQNAKFPAAEHPGICLLRLDLV